jgi:hypothetical protein
MIGPRIRLRLRGRRRLAPGLTRRLLGGRTLRRDRGGVDEPARWRARRWLQLVGAGTALVVVVFIGWLCWVGYLYVARGGPSGVTFDPDRRCSGLSFSCGVVTNLLASGVLVAFAFSFLLWRLWLLQKRYRNRAETESRQLVPTAGAIIDQVVGRDELCKAVMADLHDRAPRPHVIVGGVGTGKTAVLVRLTEYLAEKRAIPVPIRLRDATTDLDFEAMAKDRFLSEVNAGLFSLSEGESVWRRLRNDGKIVVLADGLEEAIVGTSAEPERDNLIREAIRRAHQQRLPLVIASRPHDPLRSTAAAILNLEPLSYEAALVYIGGGDSGEDERRLAWIVETADVVEAPLYLQITRELHDKGLLEPTQAGQQGVVNTRGVDRSRLRLSLLETWERALTRGHLREEVPLNRAERHAAVEHMSALATVGLMRDRLEVAFDDKAAKPVLAEVKLRLERIDEQTGQAPGVKNVDVRLAAAWAAQLDLVELRGHSVRFPHSLMQAYLASRLLDVAMLDADYCRRALRRPRPGREFLISLVLRSRSEDRAAAGDAAPDLLTPILEAAGPRDDNKVLDIYAAALEIDCVADEPQHEAISAEISGRWSRIHAHDPRTLEEGKLAVVHRLGATARIIDGRIRRGAKFRARPAYPELFAISCNDRSYPVQLAAAQEIGAGGDTAYQQVSRLLAPPCATCAAERAGRDSAEPKRSGRGSAATKRTTRSQSATGQSATSQSATSQSATGQPAAGQPAAGHPGPGHRGTGRAVPATDGGSDSLRAAIASAWLAPMLVGTLGGGLDSAPADRLLAEQSREDLDQWLRHVGRDGRRPAEEDLPISLEIALAQGFKYAANRRPVHLESGRELRMYLAEKALEMLKGARYWFSQLTLIHALCLLDLSEGPKQPGDTYGAKPEAVVRHWLDVAGREQASSAGGNGRKPAPHPFVREAAMLCLMALRTRRPQRYLWIDESGVIGQVGSRNLSHETAHRQHSLWIPPSAGWTALNERAQQLVADVLLLLNLADRGDQPSEREGRMRRSNRTDLPPCITRYRDALEPALTVGMAVSAVPGVSCVDGCGFELCPYPPKGMQPRVEMSEAFCRRQQALLTRSVRHLLTRQAPWQIMQPSQLSQFWSEMADRARGPGPRSAAVGRAGIGRRGNGRARR